ncbi:MAG: Shedu immune nuclease family protein, partial [Candidatus Sulfotelmatobacter sp.]
MEFKITSTSPDSAEVAVVPLGTTTNGTTRRALRAEIVRKVGEPKCVLRCSLFHQRKKSASEWADVEHVKLSSLKAGEGVVLHLDSDETHSLMQALAELKLIAEQRGIRFGRREVVVADKNSVVPVAGPGLKKIIESLVQADHGTEFWESLAQAKPEVIRRLSYAQLHLERERALGEFQLHLLNKDWEEAQWERLFYDNQWIFGYGLRYQFLGMLRRQANYGGGMYDRTGEQKGEFLTRTSGLEKFTVVVEIKRPDTELFEQGQYRSGVPNYSSEFIQAISQAQVNSRTWDVEGSNRERDREVLSAKRINTITPRSILIIGSTADLSDFDKKNAFELLRRDLRNPDIITFDELYYRAKYIVAQTGQPQEKEA